MQDCFAVRNCFPIRGGTISDTPEGPGWWLASDGKYYPPEQATPPAPQTPPPTPQTGAVPPQAGAVPPQTGAVPPQTGAVQPVPPSKNSGCLKIGLVAVVVFVGLGALAGGCLLLFSNEVVNEIADEIDRELGVADKSDYDLTEGECTTDFVDDAKATGTITNTSSERQGFQITVRFIEADGTLISEDSTFTDGMDPNQSTDWDVISFEDATPGMTCTVEEVRYTIFD